MIVFKAAKIKGKCTSLLVIGEGIQNYDQADHWLTEKRLDLSWKEFPRISHFKGKLEPSWKRCSTLIAMQYSFTQVK